MMNIKKIWLIPVIGALLITAFFAGCTSTNNNNYQSPTLTITQPQNESILLTNNVTVSVNVANFKLANKLGQSNVAGEGHIHYFLDVNPPTTSNQPAITAAGTYVMTIDTSYTWSNLTEGMHIFSSELVNNDHTPLNPSIIASVMVTVQSTGGSSQIIITQPSAGQSLPAGNVTISVNVLNFNIVDKQGQPAVIGEGHIHYYLDYNAPTTPGAPAVPPTGVTWETTTNTSHTFDNVAAGAHFISVELVNNDHTPLQPPITANVSFTLTSNPPGGQTFNLYLMASNTKFNVSSITVPIGAHVIVHFDNKDSGMQHNFAVYTSSSASAIIFKGTIITGKGSIIYTFDAPTSAGTYWFQCDIHPGFMNGQFIVQ